jgi:hypothetical protein
MTAISAFDMLARVGEPIGGRVHTPASAVLFVRLLHAGRE